MIAQPGTTMYRWADSGHWEFDEDDQLYGVRLTAEATDKDGESFEEWKAEMEAYRRSGMVGQAFFWHI